jgi:opacity protein-like surface antigen
MMGMTRLGRGASIVILLVGCSVAMAQSPAPDWLRSEQPFALYDPLRLSVPEWISLSLHAGNYRAVVEHNGSTSVARSLTIMPSILVTPPGWLVQPYVGAGFGLSIAEMAPESVREPQKGVPLQLEESLVMHIGGGIAYQVTPGLSLTSSARFAHYRNTDLVGRFAGPNLPLSEDGLDFNAYSVQFGLRLVY